MPAAADDKEQHCINWIRSGHSFYANEFDMKNNNDHTLNIAEATFMQGLINEAYGFTTRQLIDIKSDWNITSFPCKLQINL